MEAKPVHIGRTADDGIAPSMYALIERGVERHPEVAGRLTGKVVFRFTEDFAPVRITFNAGSVLVEDGDSRAPDLTISGRLPDVIHLATAPHWRGYPSLRKKRGLTALGRVARRRVKISGDRKLARAMMQLLSVEV